MGFDVLTEKEAAERVRISPRLLRKQIQLGQGPAVTRIGRRKFVRSDAMAEWLDRCTSIRPAGA